VIYAQCLVSAQAALRARKDAGQKVVLAVHFNRSEAEEWYHAGKIKRGDWVYRGIQDLEAELLPRLDGLHFVSQFMQDYIHAQYPALSQCHSIVLPNFIADPGIPQIDGRDADLICIGPLEPRKNQSYLIQVLHEAQKLGHRYSLALVGPGPDRQRLQQFARDLGVLDQVHFMGLQPDAKRMLPRYRAYVHSALIENFPFVLVEAAAYGLPVLAAPVGGVPEVFEDGEQGFYWPLEDPKEGARKLVALLEDEATYTRLAKGARKRFAACNAAEAVAPQLRDFILSIAGARPDARD
jgi:glycosyltransferase involved in cell wall biosynthesis